MTATWQRGLVAAGVLGPSLLMVTLALGAVFSTVFTWPRDPFSIIGTTDDSVAMVFNIGIIISGLVMLAFAAPLWRTFSPAVGGLYGIVGGSMASAGIVPADPGAIMHEIFGAAVLLGIWILLWSAAIADWRAGNRRESFAEGVLGTFALVVWLPYDFGVRWAQLGYGAAELVSFIVFGLWSFWMAKRLWIGSTGREPTRGMAETP